MPHAIKLSSPPIVYKIFRGYEDLPIGAKMEKLLFFYFTLTMSAGALMWGSICLLYGYALPSLIPFGYVVLSAINFVMCSQCGDNKLVCQVQVFTSILLPFVFQYFLGGIANSGFVMLWSLLALLGSMTFQNRRAVFFWIGLFVVLCIASFIAEVTFVDAGTSHIPVVLTALNVIIVSVTIFILSHSFIQMQAKLRAGISEQKHKLQHVNSQVNEDLKLAASFQGVIQQEVHEQEIFADKLVFERSRSHVNGNFYWQGEFLQFRVMVFVENPHEGVRGGMQAMTLWSIIENTASKTEIQTPYQLIEAIQRTIFLTFNTLEMQKNLEGIKIGAVCHDSFKNEFSYASTGVKMLLRAEQGLKLLRGFNKFHGEKTEGANGEEITFGRFMSVSSAKILFVNQPLLRHLGMEDDQALEAQKSVLTSLAEWDFSIASKELVNEVERQGEVRHDLFLLGAKL